MKPSLPQPARKSPSPLKTVTPREYHRRNSQQLRPSHHQLGPICASAAARPGHPCPGPSAGPFFVARTEFLTVNNLSILAKHVAISAILAIGMTFVVLAGGIDLSVGSVAGLGGMIAGYVITQGITLGGAHTFRR